MPSAPVWDVQGEGRWARWRARNILYEAQIHWLDAATTDGFTEDPRLICRVGDHRHLSRAARQPTVARCPRKRGRTELGASETRSPGGSLQLGPDIPRSACGQVGELARCPTKPVSSRAGAVVPTCVSYAPAHFSSGTRPHLVHVHLWRAGGLRLTPGGRRAPE